MKNEQLTKEMMDKLREAGSAEALLGLAKESGCGLDLAEAKKLFAALHEDAECELTEADLDKAVGGSWERPRIRRP